MATPHGSPKIIPILNGRVLMEASLSLSKAVHQYIAFP